MSCSATFLPYEDHVISRSTSKEPCPSNSRVVASIPDGRTFPLVVFAFLRTDEVDLHFHMFPDKLLTQKLASFLSIMCLLRIRKSDREMSATPYVLEKTHFGALVELS